jgi:hypothetical protein
VRSMPRDHVPAESSTPHPDERGCLEPVGETVSRFARSGKANPDGVLKNQGYWSQEIARFERQLRVPAVRRFRLEHRSFVSGCEADSVRVRISGFRAPSLN